MKPGNKKRGLISFAEIEKLQIHSEFDIFFKHFKERNGNVVFVTGP